LPQLFGGAPAGPRRAHRVPAVLAVEQVLVHRAGGVRVEFASELGGQPPVSGVYGVPGFQ
jgi:hypothetical protein